MSKHNTSPMGFRETLENLESQVLTRLLNVVERKGEPSDYFNGKTIKAKIMPGKWVEIIRIGDSLFLYESACHGLYPIRMELDLEDLISILEYLEK
jgi:hypothetical protein